MSEFAAPGLTFTVRTYGWPTGLAGSIGVAILDQADRAVVTARATAGITEDVTGVYKVTLTAPADAGEYLIYWTDAASSPTVTAEEELVVSGPAVLTGSYNLCTLADVKRDPTLTSVGTTHDDLIAEVITQASLDFMLEAEREVVVTSGTNPQARTHLMAGYHRDREIPVGDLSTTPTAVTIQDETGATVVTLTVGTDVELLPRVRRAWEPVTALRLRTSAGVLAASYRLVVTGTYGWPSVPQDVRYAVRDTVVYRLRNHRALTNQSPDQFEDPSGPQRLFPASAMQVIRRYRAPVIGAG
jgi:hypothetical protein